MLTYNMNERGRKTKTEFLYACIKADILSGRIAAGERLPSRRSLADHLGISVVTVQAAYGELLSEGYLTSRERSGFYAEKLNLTGSRESGEHLRRAAHGEMGPAGGPEAPGGKTEPFRELAEVPGGKTEPPRELKEVPGGRAEAPALDFPFTPFLHIVREVLNDYRDQLTRRPPNAGTPELRRAISEYLRRYRGMKADPGQIIIGSGSEYLYGFLAQLFDRQIVYGIEAQSYKKIRLVYSAYARPYELLPMDQYGISSDGLRTSLAGILHVTPFHSYPTGITAPAAKRYEYIAWARARGAYIIEDDFESEFSVPRKPLETIYAMDTSASVIYLNTFTRSMAPSMRVGYMVLPERLLGQYEERLGFYSCTVPSLDQYALAEYINRGYFEKRLDQIRRKIRQSSQDEKSECR